MAPSGERRAGHGEEPLLAEKKSSIVFDLESGLAVPIVAAWMVYLAVFMDMLGGMISTPVMPYYARSFGVGYGAVGWLFAVFQFTGIFSSPVLGSLSDRIGRRKVLLMSLLGAGVASVAQGSATSFAALFLWRGFGGIWGGVMPSARVYMADVCSPAVVKEYMAYLSSVPGAAQTFGPGLGGGLSTFGLNVPLLVNGGLSFVIALLVFFYLPESPAFKPGLSKKGAGSGAKVPGETYSLGASNFFFTMGMYGTNSMLPIVLQAKFGFDPLQVGYFMTVIAIMQLVSGIWIAVPAMKWFGERYACVGGSVVTGVFLIIAVNVQNVWLCLAAIAISRMGSNVRVSAFSAIQVSASQPETRGKMFSIIQTFSNVGRVLGPITTAHLADINAAQLPFFFSGLCLLFGALLEWTLFPKQAASDAADRLTQGGIEVGSPEDYEKLGRYVGKLLETRRYPWKSQKERVYFMLDKLLPELSTDLAHHVLDLDLTQPFAYSTEEATMPRLTRARSCGA